MRRAATNRSDINLALDWLPASIGCVQRRRVVKVVLIATILVAIGSWMLIRSHPNASRQSRTTSNEQTLDLQITASRLGLTAQPVDALSRLNETAPLDLELRSKLGLLATLNGVRLSRTKGGSHSVSVTHARFAVTGSLSSLFDEWRSLVNGLNVPIAIARADIVFEDRLWSRVFMHDVSLKSLDSGYVVHAKGLELGPKHWDEVTLMIEKRNTVMLIHWGGTASGSRPYELRCVPTPGVATEWILDIPSQSLKSLAVPGIETVPCARANGILSLVVPDNPQLKMRGRFQSVADDCAGPNWPESSALFGGSIAVAFGVEPQDDHSSWELGSVEFTSAMFDLKGKGRLVLSGEPELTWNISGSRTCAQLEANLPPSRYLEQVKAFLAASPKSSASRQAQVTLNMRGKVRASAILEPNLLWHLSGNCGIPDAHQPTP